MTRPDRKIIRAAAVAAMLTATLPLAPAANAGGFPVLDTSSLAQLKNQVTTSANQLTELEQIKVLNEQQLSALGEYGVMGSVFGANSAAGGGAEGDFYANMAKFAFDACAINLCVGDPAPTGTDIEQARTWAQKAFYSSKALDRKTERDLIETRRRGVIYTATNALALSNIVHNDLANAGNQAEALEQIVASSQTLRGDIRANSAIALATYKIQIQQLAMLTAILDVSSTAAIMETELYHENGGTDFADVFVDADYAPNDVNVRLSVTPPKR